MQRHSSPEVGIDAVRGALVEKSVIRNSDEDAILNVGFLEIINSTISGNIGDFGALCVPVTS